MKLLRECIRGLLVEQASGEADQIVRLVVGGRPDQAFELMLMIPEIDPEAVVRGLAKEFQNQSAEVGALLDAVRIQNARRPRGAPPIPYWGPKFIVLSDANEQFLKDAEQFVYGDAGPRGLARYQRVADVDGVSFLAALEPEKGIPLSVEDLTNRLQAARDE